MVSWPVLGVPKAKAFLEEFSELIYVVAVHDERVVLQEQQTLRVFRESVSEAVIRWALREDMFFRFDDGDLSEWQLLECGQESMVDRAVPTCPVESGGILGVPSSFDVEVMTAGS